MRMGKRIIPLACCLFIALQLLPRSAHAQQIYQWKDASGKVHFSTSPDHSNADASKLPELRRENIDDRIQAIKAQTPQTCIRHGGVDCAKGADTDGSVFCLDGFDKAILPFRFECLEARLQAEFLLELDGKDEQLVPHSRNLSRKYQGEKGKGLQINLRNISGVAAKEMRAEISCARRQHFQALGPDEVPAYGNASYSFLFKDNNLAPSLAEIEKCEYKVNCVNCVPVRKAQMAQ